MVPILVRISRSAPLHLKVAFFAVKASFIDMAFSANSLGTKYLNQNFLLRLAAFDPETGAVISNAHDSQLGSLLVAVAVNSVLAPLVIIFVVKYSRYRTAE